MILLSGLFVAFMMDDDQRPRRDQDSRVLVVNAMEALNLNFNKEIGQTSIIFQFAPQDSILIDCEDCITHISNYERGGIKMATQSLDGITPLTTNSFGRYMPINSSNGKVGIVFERNGIGEKILLIRKLKVLRKTRYPSLDEGGVPMGLMDVNNLYIDKLTKDNIEAQTTFFFKVKSDDKIKVDIIGANGAVPGNLICSMYKTGEEYDKKPIATGAELLAPEIDGGQDRFGFEFAHIKDVKGVNAYHLDIARIPLRSAGYKDIDTLIVDTDTLDSVSGEPDPFLEYLKSLNGDLDFACETPEKTINYSLPGKFNLGLEKRSRICFDLQLSDECIMGEEGMVNDTVWAFWFGAGKNVINRYKFQDSTRKMIRQEGLVSAYARGRKLRGKQSNGVFPKQEGAEGVFYAIIDQADKQQFLESNFDINAWNGDQVVTVSSLAYVSNGYYMLRHVPSRPMSLCLCNSGAVTTVPILFRYQQFVTKPAAPDTTSKASQDDYQNNYYEIDPASLQ